MLFKGYRGPPRDSVFYVSRLFQKSLLTKLASQSSSISQSYNFTLANLTCRHIRLIVIEWRLPYLYTTGHALLCNNALGQPRLWRYTRAKPDTCWQLGDIGLNQIQITLTRDVYMLRFNRTWFCGTLTYNKHLRVTTRAHYYFLLNLGRREWIALKLTLV